MKPASWMPVADSAVTAVLVLGLGNPLRGDDGVGWQVVEGARSLLDAFPSGRVEVDCLDLGGLALMERMVGYDRVVLVDAMHAGTVPVGEVGSLLLSDLVDPPAGHLTSAHDTSLANALELGRRLGVPLPSAVAVVGIEAREVYEFAEELSPPVKAAVPVAINVLLQTVFSMICQQSPEDAHVMSLTDHSETGGGDASVCPDKGPFRPRV